jgi:hypothetical protein
MALKFVQTGTTGAGGGTGGTYDHNLLINRGLPDQHTIESVTGLRNSLDGKYEKPNTGIPKTDLGFNVATLTDLEYLRQTSIVDIDNQLTLLAGEILQARGGEKTLKEYIDTKVPYTEWSGGGGGGGGTGSQVGYPIFEKVICDPEQTTFLLPKEYRVGTGQLEVYYDGLRMVVGDDYLETNATTVEFLWPTEVGHVVVFEVRAVVNSGLHEEYIATADQTRFRLVSPYGIGENLLQIYRNGNLLRKGRDYRELDSLIIETMYPMIEGDFITFHQAGATDPMAGTLLESELGRIKVNMGYTTMMLHDSTQSTETDYAGMYIDTFVSDQSIDKEKSFPYLWDDEEISVDTVHKSLANQTAFQAGTRVDVDIDMYPGFVILKNDTGGVDRNLFGARTPIADDVSIEQICSVVNLQRDRFTFYVFAGSLICEILRYKPKTSLRAVVDVVTNEITEIRVIADKQGRIHLVYVDDEGDIGRVRYLKYEVGEDVPTIVNISDFAYDSRHPRLVAQADTVHITYHSKRISSSYFNVEYVTLTDDQITQKDVTAYTQFDAMNPAIAIDSSGRPHILYESVELNGVTKNIKHVILQNGYSIYEEFLTTSPVFDNVDVEVGITKSDDLRVAWRSRRLGSSLSVEYCGISKENLVSGVRSIASGVLCSPPQITVDEHDVSHIVFNAAITRGDTQNICYAMGYNAESVSAVLDISSAVGKEYVSPTISVYGPELSVVFTAADKAFLITKLLTDYVSTGSIEVIYDSQTEDTKWSSLLSESVMPTGTTVQISYRISNDQILWSSWKASTLLPADTVLGRYIHIRVNMASSNPNVTPELTSLSVNYMPTFIEVQSVIKPSVSEVSGIIPLGRYEGDVTFFVSRNGGGEFKEGLKDRVADMTGMPLGRDIVIKAKIPHGAKLSAWGAIW